MSHLYDGEQPEETHLFDDVETEPRITDDLLHRDMIVVQPMKPYETPYGAGTVPDGGRLLLLLLVRASNQ